MSFLKKASQYFPFYFVIVIWVIKIIEWITGNNLGNFGTHPRHLNEWHTMLTGALIHADFGHLLNNTYPLIVCGFFIAIMFKKWSNTVFIVSYLLTGIFIFLFARSSTYHIGASGLVYCWVALLFILGLLRRDIRSLGVSLIIFFLYGSMIWGVLPYQPGVSWDGHLFGGIAGILCAFLFRSVNKEPQKQLSDAYDYNRNTQTGYEYIKRRQKQE